MEKTNNPMADFYRRKMVEWQEKQKQTEAAKDVDAAIFAADEAENYRTALARIENK